MRGLLLLSITLIGCTRPNGDPRDITGINPAFDTYVAQFEQHLGRSIGDIPMQFANLPGDMVGECIIWDVDPEFSWREIKIDPTFWANNQDVNTAMSLIFHELGHCVLNRAHIYTTWTYTNKDGPWSVPTSIMYPYLFFDSWEPFPELTSYYMNELFNFDPNSVPMLSGGGSGDMDDVVHKTVEK
jgi:hypothetical protein